MDHETMVRETAAIIGWLEKHPEERTLILWQAAQEDERAIAYDGLTAAGAVTLAGHREHLQRFMAAATFGPCSRCYAPAVYLPDLTVLAWPEMVRHRCDSRVVQPVERRALDAEVGGSNPPPATTAPVAQQQRQPAQTRSSAGANPAGGTTPPRRLLT